MDSLSPKQLAVLDQVCDNKTYVEAALELGVSLRVIRNHMSATVSKLDLWTEGDSKHKLPKACRQLGAWETRRMTGLTL